MFHDVEISHFIAKFVTIQTRDQAGIVDGAVIEVSRTPRGVFGLSRALQSFHAHTLWCWYRDNIESP